MKYDIKIVAELAWFVGVAVLAYAAQQTGQQDFGQITDWGAWGVAFVTGLGRVAAAAFATFLTSRLLKGGDAP